ncbi:gp53-like domain-containing protein [Serratia marcescens]|uniref:gp53-like domain-containing protein n=1 Tax=Serratia marcescens TaxID=615 RepID=UPI003FA6B25B
MRKVGSTTDTADANGEYTNGNVAQGIPPTIINAEMLNTFQRELIGVVEGAEMELDPSDDNQVFKSIERLIIDKSIGVLQPRGYQLFPSGLIIQWGSEYSDDASMMINYLKPYSIATFFAVTTKITSEDSRFATTGATTKTGFTAYGRLGNDVAPLNNFMWFSIGA